MFRLRMRVWRFIRLPTVLGRVCKNTRETPKFSPQRPCGRPVNERPGPMRIVLEIQRGLASESSDVTYLVKTVPKTYVQGPKQEVCLERRFLVRSLGANLQAVVAEVESLQRHQISDCVRNLDGRRSRGSHC